MMLKARLVGNEIVCGRPRCRGDGTAFGLRVKMLTLDGERFDFDLAGTMSQREDKEGVFYAERPHIQYARDGGDAYFRRATRGNPNTEHQESRNRASYPPFRAEDLPIRCRCRRCEWTSWVSADLLLLA